MGEARHKFKISPIWPQERRLCSEGAAGEVLSGLSSLWGWTQTCRLTGLSRALQSCWMPLAVIFFSSLRDLHIWSYFFFSRLSVNLMWFQNPFVSVLWRLILTQGCCVGCCLPSPGSYPQNSALLSAVRWKCLPAVTFQVAVTSSIRCWNQHDISHGTSS